MSRRAGCLVMHTASKADGNRYASIERVPVVFDTCVPFMVSVRLALVNTDPVESVTIPEIRLGECPHSAPMTWSTETSTERTGGR